MVGCRVSAVGGSVSENGEMAPMGALKKEDCALLPPPLATHTHQQWTDTMNQTLPEVLRQAP